MPRNLIATCAVAAVVGLASAYAGVKLLQRTQAPPAPKTFDPATFDPEYRTLSGYAAAAAANAQVAMPAAEGPAAAGNVEDSPDTPAADRVKIYRNIAADYRARGDYVAALRYAREANRIETQP